MRDFVILFILIIFIYNFRIIEYPYIAFLFNLTENIFMSELWPIQDIVAVSVFC